ncbi:30S ribosomal protein S13 [candidate division WWE3 bacterium CG_4_9_14_3_um_filter_34_6]|uniref:Small ribosomal subunit protein uS13 n=1 Tax=candidate division WWE3 bacterium CG_4_9_14_3_um_filter_34_6 TaxID=1975079 RepID=A0A2M7X4F7_UNCKA|nr:MAG: 30S ribosomal protein S13 [candidate division WWE3 bacterium CG_4_9_14_3_um_filter_34_6]
MPRINGVDIPENKRIVVSLTYIYGIGVSMAKKILEKAKIDGDIRAKDLNDDQISSIRNSIEKLQCMVEGELKRVVSQNIKRYKDIQCYRGTRHLKNLPVRGQKTQKNARTKRGKRVAVGGANPKVVAKT